MYIVIEGQDATGKSTQVEMLAKYFEAQGKLVTTIHEPDGALPQAKILRELIKNKTYQLEPLTHVLLFTAARLELWRKLALPTLQQSGVVISARSWWSTLAYQGYGQGISLSKIVRLTKQIMPADYVTPTKSVILTLDSATRLSRQTIRDDLSSQDTFESKPTDFQHKVDQAYLQIARKFDIPTIDASPSPEIIHQQLLKLFGF